MPPVPHCPSCGSRRTVPVLYGFPSPAVANLERDGKAILGGCILYDGRPEFGCRECGHRWSDDS